MKKLTTEMLRQMIDGVKNFDYGDLSSDQTETGKNGRKLIESCDFSSLSNLPDYDANPSYDWHGSIVMNGEKGDIITFQVSFVVPLIVPARNVDDYSYHYFFSDIASEKLELFESIAEKHGYYLVEYDELIELAKLIGVSRKDVQRLLAIT